MVTGADPDGKQAGALTSLETELYRLAGAVPDPELPVVTLEELGILRGVRVLGPGRVEVRLTPTYTGCPAIESMSADITRVLQDHGIPDVHVRPVLSPPWTTDDISDEGRRKLRESGIAPPRRRDTAGSVTVPLGPTRTADAPDGQSGKVTGARTAGTMAAATRSGIEDAVCCPHCGCAETELLSRFSSTACKALRRCLACREPFDHFKEL